MRKDLISYGSYFRNIALEKSGDEFLDYAWAYKSYVCFFENNYYQKFMSCISEDSSKYDTFKKIKNIVEILNSEIDMLDHLVIRDLTEHIYDIIDDCRIQMNQVQNCEINRKVDDPDFTMLVSLFVPLFRANMSEYEEYSENYKDVFNLICNLKV